MNTLEQTLSKILEKALNVAEQTGEFAMEQAPLLLQEFFYWHIANATLGLLLGFIIAIIINKIALKVSKHEEEEFVYYLINVLQFAPILIFCINLYDLVFILVAPKLYLIEYFVK